MSPLTVPVALPAQGSVGSVLRVMELMAASIDTPAGRVPPLWLRISSDPCRATSIQPPGYDVSSYVPAEAELPLKLMTSAWLGPKFAITSSEGACPGGGHTKMRHAPGFVRSPAPGTQP